MTLFPALLLAAAGAANAWTFTVYPDSECESTPSGSPSGTANVGCTSTPANHKSFEITSMGNCILYLYTDLDTCNNDDTDFEQVYDFGEEDECIPPDFTWDAYSIQDC
jgi:hypothetical protein